MQCPFCNQELKVIKTDLLEDSTEVFLGRCHSCQYEALYSVINNEEQLKKYTKYYLTTKELNEIWKD